MPIANKAPEKKAQKGTYKKKTKGPLTDAEAPTKRADKPPSKDGTQRGRIKGTKNKGTQLLEDAQALIAEKFDVVNWHPVIHMMLVAADSEKDDALRLSAAAKAAPYVASQLKSIELTGKDEGPIDVDISDPLDHLRRLAGLDKDDDDSDD